MNGAHRLLSGINRLVVVDYNGDPGVTVPGTGSVEWHQFLADVHQADFRRGPK